MATSKIEKEL